MTTDPRHEPGDEPSDGGDGAGPLPSALWRSPIPTGLLDRGGDWVVTNEALDAVLGGDRPPFATLLDEPGLDPAVVLADDAPPPLRLRLPDGRTADAVVTADRDHRLVQLLERGEVERLETRARDAVAALESFVARVSHDLRNPIGTARGFAELLVTDGQGGTFAERIQSSTDRAADLLTALVTEARTTGRVPAPDEIDVDALVAAVHEELADRLAPRGVRLETAGELPRLRGDERLLRRALELVVTTLAERDPDVGRVTVSAERVSRGWELVVDDDGPPVATEDLDALDTGEPGTALGLPLARAAIERRGGSLDVTPREPAGLRVRLHLPQRRAGDPDARR